MSCIQREIKKQRCIFTTNSCTLFILSISFFFSFFFVESLLPHPPPPPPPTPPTSPPPLISSPFHLSPAPPSPSPLPHSLHPSNPASLSSVEQFVLAMVQGIPCCTACSLTVELVRMLAGESVHSCHSACLSWGGNCWCCLPLSVWLVLLWHSAHSWCLLMLEH